MICSDINTALSSLLARYDKDQVAIVYDENLQSPITNHQLPIITVSESAKSLETVSLIWDFLFDHGITRKGVLVCIGGGVLTDLGAFAASTYKRGIDCILVPTTLLAMVDASIGGKTGINYRGLKNAIGTFAQPVDTLIWPGWLQTLPPQQLLSGFAEMLKTGLITNHQSPDGVPDKRGNPRRKGHQSPITNHQSPITNHQCLWNRLLQYDLETMDIDALTPLIEQCVQVKQSIVAADPQEHGLRKVLNLGHTFGHALEELSAISHQPSVVTNHQSPLAISHSPFRLSPLPHGFAVLYGLIAELYLSVVLLGCPREPLQQLTQRMLAYYGRPQCNCSDRERLIALMQQDKKNERTAQINCTLLRSVGEPVINQIISPALANEALDYLFSL